MTLARALHLTPHASPANGDADGRTFEWGVPDGWQQGRGAFGGLTLAALAKAGAATLAASDRPLRTITGEIPAAVAVGRARLRAKVLRSGSALATVAVDLAPYDGGEVAAHAVLNFGKTRDVGFDRAGAAVTLPVFDGPAIDGLPREPPAFSQHFEFRPTRGAAFGGAADAVTEGWVRLRDPGDVEPAIALIAMVDAWFPSVMAAMTRPRPFGTISFAAHLFDRGWSPREPLYHRSRLLASQQGYFAELRELFTTRGELCAVNQQTMAIIK